MDSEEIFKRKDWIELVRKLKEDELKKMNISGFTMAVYIIFVLTICNSIINSLPEILSQKRYFILLLAAILNFLTYIFKLFRTINPATMPNKEDFNELDKQSLFLGHIIDLATWLVITIVNIFSILFYWSILGWLGIMPYVIFTLIYIKNSILKIKFIYEKFYFKKPRVKKIGKVSFVQKYLSKEEIVKIRNNAIVFIRIINVIFLIISSLSILQIASFKIFLKDINIFKHSIYVAAVIVAFNIITLYIHKRIIYSWLECFEKEIFEDDLSIEQIRKKFINVYMSKVDIEFLSFRK